MVEEEKEDAEKEQEEETDVDDEYDPYNDDDTINEPNFIWNENKHTSWGMCYFKALEDDKVFGNGKHVRFNSPPPSRRSRRHHRRK